MAVPSSIMCILLSLCFVGCASKKNKEVDYETINEVIKNEASVQLPSDLKTIDEIPSFEETKDFIAPGFLFTINHPTDEKLRGRFRVEFDGVLKLPYNIKVDVKNKTFNEVRAEVLKQTNSFYQNGSEGVYFSLVEKDYWVEVRGFVKKPGHYLVKRKESIDKVIDKAGGLSGNIRDDLFVVSFKQGEESYSISLNQYYQNNVLNKQFTWIGGDSVFVNILNEDSSSDSLPTVSVLGGVLNPGKTIYKENATIFDYISKAGGVIPNLGYEEVYVIRKEGKRYRIIQFDIRDMDSIPTIRSGDVVMLNGEKKSMMDKIFERATQIGAIISAIALVIVAF